MIFRTTRALGPIQSGAPDFQIPVPITQLYMQGQNNNSSCTTLTFFVALVRRKVKKQTAVGPVAAAALLSAPRREERLRRVSSVVSFRVSPSANRKDLNPEKTLSNHFLFQFGLCTPVCHWITPNLRPNRSSNAFVLYRY